MSYLTFYEYDSSYCAETSLQGGKDREAGDCCSNPSKRVGKVAVVVMRVAQIIIVFKVDPT